MRSQGRLQLCAILSVYERNQHEPLGFGLHGLLSARRSALRRLNGIDTDLWNPLATPDSCRYTAERCKSNKRALQQRLGLAPAPGVPLLAVVSRLTEQKGLDWLLEIAPQLLALPAQLALLGGGDAKLERGFLALAQSHPQQVSATIGFDEALAHLIEAGADAFLMPSRFEPCGLNQMYSQRYGTPPIVHATGGLVDTVEDGVTGFIFSPMTAETFLASIHRALAVYRDKQAWHAIQHNAMTRDFSWKKSAADYLALYKSM
jgi:starch synthase